MAASVITFGRQLQVLWGHLGINQKVSIVLALFAVATVIGTMLHISKQPDYRLLCTGMSLEDAAKCVEKLEDEKISVQLRDHGQAIYVPSADVYRARLMLASSGLPKDSSAGFELFEQPKFGLTEFAQQVNYQRALQGELERTIKSVDGIRAARVILVMPKDRLFVPEKDKMASASIMLTLATGARIGAEQVRSIRQLVSAAVPGLSGGRVTITDHQGRMLSDDPVGEDLGTVQATRNLDIRRSVEEALARKAQDMLDASLGSGQAIVRVSAELDFRRVERHNETFNSEGRVLIHENLKTETNEEPGKQSSSGSSRVAVGDPSKVTTEVASGGKSKRQDVESEYRVPTGRESIVDLGGNIARLSVSVSVAKGATPRDAEALRGIERLVRSAVGAVSEGTRRDTVEVLEMAFASTKDVLPAANMTWLSALPILGMDYVKPIAGGILLFMLYMWGRRTLRGLAVERESVGTTVSNMLGGGAAGALSEGAGGMALDGGHSTAVHAMPLHGGGIDAHGTEDDLDTVSRLAEQSPETVAKWITQTVRSR